VAAFRVNRTELLQSLQTVQPGLSPREVVEQSSCFVFSDGQVMTYNDEIACRMKSPLPSSFSGAVSAKPLVDVLSKMPEETVDIEPNEKELIVHGKRRSFGVLCQAEIILPIEHADLPGEDWKSLHPDFAEAVSIVQECASTDQSQFVMTCIHVHPKWIEACDNFQLTRYRIATGVNSPCLVRKDSLKHIITQAAQDFTETDAWIHYRTPSGMIMSCRRYAESYHNLTEHIKFEGNKAVLPDGLSDASERAEVFSSENTDENRVRIYIKPGRMMIRSMGVSGWYKEEKKINYDGPELRFQIAPKLLREIMKKHTECEISDNKLKVKLDKWVYVTYLRTIEDKAEAA
jgi:DNA polymerase III sliding clamp (beta) subunit (PCNA family)